MAPEQIRHTYTGPGVNKTPDISPAVTYPRRTKKRRGTGAVGAALAAVMALQPLAYDRVSHHNKNAATVASQGIFYRSVAEQAALKKDSPLPTIPTLPKNGVLIDTKTSKIEPAKCAVQWETLNKGICFTKFREYDSDIFVVRADLKGPNVSVHPSFVAGPDKLGKLNEAVKREGATAASNASFFVGTHPLGILVDSGRLIYKDNSPQQVLIVHNDNSAEILPTEQALRKDPATMKFALSGSHVLVQNGITTTDFGPDKGGMLYDQHPRTAIGIDKDGMLFMVVVDGRRSKSRGLNMPELAKVMRRLGVTVAINLDGGKSTQMSLENEGTVNNPSNGDQNLSTFVAVYAKAS